MVEPKQKDSALGIDWTPVDTAIAQNAHPQLAKRLDAIAGDNEGNLIAPGINKIYARIGGDTEASDVMIDPLFDASRLQVNAPIKVYWDTELNSYVWDNKSSIAAYNQASGGTPPQTALNLASYILQVPNAQLPNAQDLNSLTDNSLLKVLAAGVLDEAVVSTDYVKPLTGTGVNNDTMFTGQQSQSHGGLGTDISTSQTGRIIKTGANSASTIKDNLVATAAPGAGDDSNDGYAVGSLWLDVTNDHAYIAIDVTVAAAVWLQLDGSTVDWANPGTIGSTTPNTGAFTTLTATTGTFNPNSNNRTEILIGGVQETRSESSNLTQPTYHIQRRSGGSIGSESATQNTQVIARWEAQAYGTAFATVGYLQYEATETHSGSVRGTKATVRTTQAGGTTPRDFVFQDYGALGLPALSANPSSPANPDIWYNDATFRHMLNSSGIVETIVTGSFKQTTTVRVNGVTAKTEITSGAPTIAAASVAIGTAYRIQASGFCTNHVALGGTTIFSVDIGSVTVFSVTLTPGSVTNKGWRMECEITVYTTGATGTLWAHGGVWLNTVWGLDANVATSTIDWTSSKTIKAHLTPSSTLNDTTCTNLTIERL